MAASRFILNNERKASGGGFYPEIMHKSTHHEIILGMSGFFLFTML